MLDAEQIRQIREASRCSQAYREVATLDLLIEILLELQAIRHATETEAVEDAEPDPFQTLNGPSKDPNPLRYGVKGEYGE